MRPGRGRERVRRATFDDLEGLRHLIELSARELSAGDYTPAQIEGALRGAFGVDTQLIRDGTYFVVEQDGAFVACGGWSHRRTMFGGDAREGRDSGELDPATDAARVRAFFVHPAATRRGLAASLLERCEAEAWSRGFRRLELMATLPGVRFYAARGYVPAASIQWSLGDGLAIEFVPMSKALRSPPPRAGSRTRR